MRVEDIPDFPALEQLARALWHQGTTRGAALFVGAGFSRNAERSGMDTPEPPLWDDLAREMVKQLYPGTDGEARRDPLRLAQEYRTYFGQAALDEFVRTHIKDGAWEPGPLHRSLLDLPWSDILTTNWDTLLERTAASVGSQSYEIVRSVGELPHARSPRIIKLHGSLGTSEHFIIAEEDYRTYPTRFAAFVNTARQIFIESELCLLGFSGDDPNFLQWSGWVRDHLGESARRIYLVGDLDLGPAKRKFLEARNIAPIDLAPLVQERDTTQRASAATRRILDYLIQSTPKPQHAWKPIDPFAENLAPDIRRLQSDPDYAASMVDQIARSVWVRDRQTYPGWLLCPAGTREAVRTNTQSVLPLNTAWIEKLPTDRRAEILYELTWRHAVSHWPIDIQLMPFLEKVADPGEPCGLEKRHQLEIATALLATAGQLGDNNAFARWAGVLNSHAEPGSDLYAELIYQRCLRARDCLDFKTLSQELENVSGPDPVWYLRRASLLAELGAFTQAGRLINEARMDLEKRQRGDRNSLWVRSRRAWAEWLTPAVRRDPFVGATDRLPLEFQEARCDPNDEINLIREQSADELRRRNEEAVAVVPSFEPGSYREPRNAIRLRSPAFVTSIDRLRQLMERAGLPLRLNLYDMIGKSADDATELAFEPTFPWYVQLVRVANNPLDPLFARYFGRIAVAQLAEGVSIALSQQLNELIQYWLSKISSPQESGVDAGFVSGRLRLAIEALARVSIRENEQTGKNHFNLAMELAHNRSVTDYWLFEPIGNLASYSALAVPPAARAALVFQALQFPISSEKGINIGGWPNPILTLFETPPARPDGNLNWNHRVEELISAARPGNTARAEAVLRLAYLAKHKALADAELRGFAQALWASTEGERTPLPAGTGLLAPVFAFLPAPSDIDVKKRVQAFLFETDVKSMLAASPPTNSAAVEEKRKWLLGVQNAKLEQLRPTAEQAARLFDGLASWRPLQANEATIGTLAAGFYLDFYERIRRLIGEALALVVVPALVSADRTGERARALFGLIDTASVSAALAALPYFSEAGDEVRAEILRRLRRGINWRSFDQVAASAMAIEVWARLGLEATGSQLPGELIEQVVWAIETRRDSALHPLLRSASSLIEMNRFTTEHKLRINDALGDLISATAYDGIDLDSRDAVSVSLVRAECVRLVRALQGSSIDETNLSKWLADAATDPLPEVRFALES
jgi:hypothetical protein